MSPPVFYSIPLSPPGRVVEYVAKELGVTLDFKDFDFFGGSLTSSEFTAKNPTRTVPALDDNGTSIFDSHAIVVYLVDKYGTNDSLYPKDAVERAKVNAVLFFETQFLFGRTRSALEPLLYDKVGFTYDCLVVKLGDSLDRFERLLVLGESNFVAGNSVTIADFACLTSLGLLEIFYPVDTAKYPTIDAWRKRIYSKYPYVKEREAEASAGLKKLIDDSWTDKSLH